MHVLLPIFMVAESAAAPTVVWISEPVRPNETAVVQGFGLSAVDQVRVQVLGSGNPTTVMATEVRRAIKRHRAATETMQIQVSDSGLHFVVPPSLKWPAAFEMRLVESAPDTSAIAPQQAPPRLINMPHVKWIQGDEGSRSSR